MHALDMKSNTLVNLGKLSLKIVIEFILFFLNLLPQTAGGKITEGYQHYTKEIRLTFKKLNI